MKLKEKKCFPQNYWNTDNACLAKSAPVAGIGDPSIVQIAFIRIIDQLTKNLKLYRLCTEISLASRPSLFVCLFIDRPM